MAVRKKQKQKNTTSVIGYYAGAAVSLALVTALAFISLQLSMTALAICGGGAFLLYEHQKRTSWQKIARGNFKKLQEQQDDIAKDIALQRFALEDIKDDLRDIKAAQKNAPTQPQENFHKPARSSAAPPMLEPVPAKLRGTTAERRKDPPLSSTPANTDPHADYDALSDMVVKELIQHAVRNNRVDVFLQPIMRLPQRQTKFYEIFARIRAKPGMYLPASRYMNLAREDKVMHKIDHLLLMQCLKTIEETAHLDGAAPIFINITTATLSNSLFMKQLLGFLSQNRDMAPRLVFEIRQEEFERMKPAMLEILRGLGRLGCSLSIDHVKKLEFDIKFLQVLKVRFVKINASELFQSTRTERGFADMNRFKKRLEGNGIGFIVEKIEDEKTLREILDYDIHYGQGYLFGKPDLEGAYDSRKRVRRTSERTTFG